MIRNYIKSITWLPTLAILFTACGDSARVFDATGTFEADEIIVSSESSGKLRSFAVEEGQQLDANQYLGYIDTTQLALSRKQLQAQIRAVRSKKPDISAQLAALEEQLKAAETEQRRTSNLLQADAATPKQLDDINAQIDLIKGNIRGLKTSLMTNTKSLEWEVGPLEAQILQVDDKITKSKILNPIKGTVLSAYAEPHEQISVGQPLYRIADLSEITLKAYISGDQFSQVALDQSLAVYTDDGSGSFKETTGTVYWIADQAEFTPKSIQTKNERASKVYAIKIRVKNDGSYKIGMYGEVDFNTTL